MEFEAHIGRKPPSARCAALCFDKIDLEKGVETLGPDGSVATLKRPWSILAYQIAGDGRAAAAPRRGQRFGARYAACGTRIIGAAVETATRGSRHAGAS